MVEYTVDAETAELEFERFGELMDLDFDTETMDVDDLGDFNKLKRKFIRAVRQGKLTVNDNGEPVFCDITFAEPTGATMFTMNRIPDSQPVKRLVSIMSQMTGKPEPYFSRLKASEFGICSMLVTFFLA